MSGTTRRSALRLIGGAAGLALGGADVAAAAQHASAVLAAVARGKAYTPRFFTAHEWPMVRLLADMILPRDERSGSATDAGVPEFIDYLMNDPMDDDRSRESHQTAMRGGLAWIDAECARRFGHGFLECTDAERITLLDDIAYDSPRGKDDTDLREPRDLRVRVEYGPSFFNSFRDLTAAGFFSSKMGVDDLGYQGNVMVAEWKGPPPEVLKRLGIEEG
jgi:gluconate 2-dehydrogenase gamma chain